MFKTFSSAGKHPRLPRQALCALNPTRGAGSARGFAPFAEGTWRARKPAPSCLVSHNVKRAERRARPDMYLSASARFIIWGLLLGYGSPETFQLRIPLRLVVLFFYLSGAATYTWAIAGWGRVETQCECRHRRRKRSSLGSKNRNISAIAKISSNDAGGSLRRERCAPS